MQLQEVPRWAYCCKASKYLLRLGYLVVLVAMDGFVSVAGVMGKWDR
jgi:hypothetical protein